jgi:hypothetical protein
VQRGDERLAPVGGERQRIRRHPAERDAPGAVRIDAEVGARLGLLGDPSISTEEVHRLTIALRRAREELAAARADAQLRIETERRVARTAKQHAARIDRLRRSSEADYEKRLDEIRGRLDRLQRSRNS